MVQPWQTIYCHRHAHIQEDECGAPEFYTSGAKLTLLDGADAKIDLASFTQAVAATGQVGVHNVQKGALSITTATENGAVYTVAEIEALCAVAKANDIPVHLDGARFESWRRSRKFWRHQKRLPGRRGRHPVQPRPRMGI
jgi:threonine aldolase